MLLNFLFNRPCKIKHATVRQLWRQEVFRREDACTTKVPREENPADLMCSMQNRDGLAQKLAALGFVAAHQSERGDV